MTFRHLARILDDRRLWQPIVVVAAGVVVAGFGFRRFLVPQWIMACLFVPVGAAAYLLRSRLPAGIGRRPTPRIATTGVAGSTEMVSVSDLWIRNRLPRVNAFLERAPWFPTLGMGALLWFGLAIPHPEVPWEPPVWIGPPTTVALGIEENAVGCPASGAMKLVERDLFRHSGIRFGAYPSPSSVDTSHGLDLAIRFSCDGARVAVEMGPSLPPEEQLFLTFDADGGIGDLEAFWERATFYAERDLAPVQTGDPPVDVNQLNRWALGEYPKGDEGSEATGLEVLAELGLLGPTGPWPGPPVGSRLRTVVESGAESHNPGGPESLLSQAAILTWSGGPPYEAPELALRAIEHLPSAPYAWLILGEAQAASNRWGESLASFRRASDLAPHLLGPRLALARHLRYTHQHVAALEILEPLLAVSFPHPATALEAGWTHLSRGDLVEAARFANVAASGSASAEVGRGVQELQAQIAYYEGDWGRHRELLNALAASALTQTDSWEYRVQSALALWTYERSDQAEIEALELTQEIRDREHEAVPPGEAVRRQALFGVILALGGDVEGGKRHGLEALRRLPLTEHGTLGPSQHWAMATVHLIAGEHIPAIDGFGYSVHVPSRYSRALVRMDPLMKPLMDEPTFLEIVRRAPSVPTGSD